ncbi:MAG: hypothetical protein JJ892_03845 [Balneola sp.]|nr:hypothetical protein [Balneola sp.]MBO6652170.1 hypothetical protein [Balneola sp.]MBO6710703.1 hypothetical protein [Balneola sp.]MBO6799389.1 hypothetical protein [Balneola sp.]MBO6869482.1 hypothetical protein [Balneola sp.]
METVKKIAAGLDKLKKIILFIAYLGLFLFLTYPIILYIAPVSFLETIFWLPLNLIQLLSSQVMETTNLEVWHSRAFAITIYAIISSSVVGIFNYPFTYPKIFIERSKRVPVLVSIVVICVILGFSKHPNFSPTTGEPLKKYYSNPNGTIELLPLEWNYHPTYGEPLNLITKDIVRRYEEQTKEQKENNDKPISNSSNKNSSPYSNSIGQNHSASSIAQNNGVESKNFNLTQNETQKLAVTKRSQEDDFMDSFEKALNSTQIESEWDSDQYWISLISSQKINVFFTEQRNQDALKIISRLRKSNSNVHYEVVSSNQAKLHDSNLYYRYGQLKIAQAIQNIISDIELIKLRRNEEAGSTISLWIN